ncbi:MAG: DUF362 domain-containing protein [Armatimonadota bacterium]
MNVDESRRMFLLGLASKGADAVRQSPLVSAFIQLTKKVGPTVVEANRPQAVTSDMRLHSDMVREMVFASVRQLTGQKKDQLAWSQLFDKSDVVGIKVNTLFGPGACTSPEVVNAVVEGVKLAGVAADKIIIWDRTDADLLKCKFRLNREAGVKCYGTNSDYETEATKVGSFEGRLSKILTQQITALVNLPILKHHSITGLSCAFKNHYGSFDNPGQHHGNGCDPYLSEVNSLPSIRNKTRLILCDALRPLCDGGPGFTPKFQWGYGSILASFDALAMDVIGTKIIDNRRKEMGIATLEASGKPVRHLVTAAKMGLGEGDLHHIRVIKA